MIDINGACVRVCVCIVASCGSPAQRDSFLSFWTHISSNEYRLTVEHADTYTSGDVTDDARNHTQGLTPPLVLNACETTREHGMARCRANF